MENAWAIALVGSPDHKNDVAMPLSLFGGLRPVEAKRALHDLLAGVNRASINIPQVLGYSRIAGTPVVAGLYTLLLPLIAFAIFGSSRHLVVAADSATAAIFSSSLSRTAVPASEQYMALVCMVALLTAALLLVARIFKLGFLADFLSRTVLTGFLAGVGLQVGIAMLSDMFGVAADSRYSLVRVWQIMDGLPHLHYPTLALRQNRDAVIADRTAQQHLVPGTGAVGGKVDSFWHQPNSCRVDEQPIALTFLDDFGIASHNLHARVRRRLAQRIHHAPEFIHREALFDDEGGAQKQRRCAAHRQIVHRAVNGERTDVAAGKEQWLHYEGIGGDGETLAVHIHDCLVIQARQHRILKRRQEDVANQLGAQLAAAAVPQQDCVFGRERRRATELEFYFGVGFRGHALSYFATAWRR